MTDKYFVFLEKERKEEKYCEDVVKMKGSKNEFIILKVKLAFYKLKRCMGFKQLSSVSERTLKK